MNVAAPKSTCTIPCLKCPLQRLDHFRRFAPEELEFMNSFKTGEMTAAAGATVLLETSHSAHLYTVFSGTAFRYKMLEDGRRQIMNFVFPGDIIGLQGSIMGEMRHSVEVLSPVLLCIFERNRLMDLYRNHPDLAFDITWMAAREEQILDEGLLNIGRRSAEERAAYLIAYLFVRARPLGLIKGRRLNMPLTQLHIADALGLSIVHTNRMLKRLAARKLIRWQERGCDVLDLDRLLELAQWDGLFEEPRPYL